MTTQPAPVSNPSPNAWTELGIHFSHHPAQHEAHHRLEAMAIGMRFKLKHLISESIRPDTRGGAMMAAKAVIRQALKLGLIRVVTGVASLIPYYEKVK